jgi:cytidylate kinase
MSERFYYWNPMRIDRYDLVVNTGVMDLDTTVDVIVSAYQDKAARAVQPTA